MQSSPSVLQPFKLGDCGIACTNVVCATSLLKTFFLLNRKIQERKAEVWFTRSPMKADCLSLTLSQNSLMHRKSCCLLVLQKMRSEQGDWHHPDVFSYLLIDWQSFWVLTVHQKTARKFKFSKHLEIKMPVIFICCHCLFTVEGSKFYEEVLHTQWGRWQLRSLYADTADIVGCLESIIQVPRELRFLHHKNTCSYLSLWYL